MERSISARGRWTVALAAGVAAAIALSGCALLLPPSWRGKAPVPLAGPIDSQALDGAPSDGDDDPRTLSDEDLAARVAADRERLVEIASEPGSGPLATEESEAELREISARLPRYQHELERRGQADTSSAEPTVIR